MPDDDFSVWPRSVWLEVCGEEEATEPLWAAVEPFVVFGVSVFAMVVYADNFNRENRNV